MGNKQAQLEKEILREYRANLKNQSYHQILTKAENRQLVLLCDYNYWTKDVYQKIGFDNHNVCYRGGHESFYRRLGLVKPDLQNGRHFKAVKNSQKSLTLIDESSRRFEFDVPRFFTGGRIESLFQERLRHRTWSNHYDYRDSDEIRVIGFRHPLAVVEVINYEECFRPEFYCLNVDDKSCVFKLSDPTTFLEIYESYISPDTSRILILPATPPPRGRVMTRNETSSPYEFSRHDFNGIDVIFARDNFPGECYAFDNRHRNRYLFIGCQKSIAKIDLDEKFRTVAFSDLSLSTDVTQIKSSWTGAYLAARCVFPKRAVKYSINEIYVIDALKLRVLLTVSAGGPYWPFTETVNSVVFPQFSACDRTIAVMRNTDSHRTIRVYKLPLLRVNLQEMCRSVIRQVTGRESNIDDLPLPRIIKSYLKYKL
ncbi:uncharacterized protein LOC141907269 [Tubulanus polymorphus]|uniref:uncharacterized protein LOC141907269 n=1 Tax=Tubulanus polymorphus TaxID=672921 RepID=UPI003DA69ED8